MSTILFDIETSPDAVEIYKRLPSIGAWPGRGMKTQNHNIISFAFKELGSNKTYCISGWDLNQDWYNYDEPLVLEIFNVLKDATQIITHNGRKFDMQAINTRLLKYGHPPVPAIKHIDTCVLARHKLSMYSNTLDDIAEYLQVGKKISWPNKWDLWTDIAFNKASRKELDMMARYNIQDVVLLEKVYLKLRPYVGTAALNQNVIADSESPVCPTCGSSNLHSNGFRADSTGLFKRLACGDCGSWSKEYKKKVGAAPL